MGASISLHETCSLGLTDSVATRVCACGNGWMQNIGASIMNCGGSRGLI